MPSAGFAISNPCPSVCIRGFNASFRLSRTASVLNLSLDFRGETATVVRMPEATPFDDFLGEEAVDSEGTPVGTLACYWENEEHRPIFLGIDLPEHPGKTRLVPVKGTQLNESQSYVRLGFTREKIQNAPCLDCECELDKNLEGDVYRYYGINYFAVKAMAVEKAQRHLRRISPDVPGAGYRLPPNA
jgi:hypothetical protein